MADNSKIEWTEATWNPVTGCTKVSPGCDNCLAPETRVLRADMTWVPIENVRVGDRLVSFTETPELGRNRVWEEAIVQATWETEKPAVEVELANGTKLIASEDHKWLVAKRSQSAWWRETIGLNFKTDLRALRCEPTDTASADYQAGYIAGVTAGDGTFRWDPEWRSSTLGYPQTYWRVAKLADDVAVLDRLVTYLARLGVEVAVRPFNQGSSVFTQTPRPMAKVETRRLADMPTIAGLCEERPTREWMAGWLAGMFDTDASYSGGNLRFCQAKPNDVLDRVVRYGKELGFELQREDYAGTQCPGARLVGGIAENIAFLSAVSPALERRCRDFYGKRIETPSVPVVGIRRGPAQRLIDITTSTGTFIAEGALTHNCYAETFAERWRGTPGHYFENGFDLTLRPERLEQPLKWKRPRRVFVNSMSDLFHDAVPDEFIARVFATMARAPQHTFQLLTKRHARMRSLLGGLDGSPHRLLEATVDEETALAIYEADWPLPNVWAGVSVETQQWAKIRVPALLETPAAVRWLSCEPLLGPIQLRTGVYGMGDGERWGTSLNGIGWVVLGGESGPGARPMELDWAHSLVQQCQVADVPVFVKQLGSKWAASVTGLLPVDAKRDTKGGTPGYWPDDLQVREYPRVAEVVA